MENYRGFLIVSKSQENDITIEVSDNLVAYRHSVAGKQVDAAKLMEEAKSWVDAKCEEESSQIWNRLLESRKELVG